MGLLQLTKTRKKIYLLSLSSLLFVACTAKIPVNNGEQIQRISGNQLKPVKSNDLRLSFDIKGINDIKALDVYLTVNFDDPFQTGSNPLGNNFHISKLINTDTTTVDVIFNNVPDGGPYFAVIGAFDSPEGTPDRNNITKEDLTILSTGKNWARSLNSALVGNGQVTFSDGLNSFSVKLLLSELNRIGAEITPQNGATTKGGIGVSP